MKKGKIGLVSLGCPKNLVDSEGMAGRLTQAGYELSPHQEEADVVLINTCGFIEAAKEESIDRILSFARRRTDGALKGLVVTGCLAQRYARELADEIPEADAFLTLAEEAEIVTVVDRLLGTGGPRPNQGADRPQARRLLTPFHTAYLKISEGCSNRCTYCTIPLIRGPHVSREHRELVAETQELCRRGVREVILIGQDITRYGNDRGTEENLTSLLGELQGIEGLDWIRLMYVHPDHVTEPLITLMASASNIVPYLDIPIQHVHGPILRRMGRRGSGQILRESIADLRRRVPGLVLRTTLMVGFPGETEEAFRELFDFVEETRFDHLGVFAYSPEEGTPAAGYPGQVGDGTKAERKDAILHLQSRISREINQRRIGTTLQVLIEGTSPETDLLLAGRYYGQAPEVDGIVLINKGHAITGAFSDVRITDAHIYDLVGEVLE